LVLNHVIVLVGGNMSNRYTNLDGFNIIQVSKNEWILQVVNSVAYEGNFREVALFAIKKYGFSIKEIDMAIADMIELGNNAAHFGMWSSFIYSFKQDLTPIRKAS
jgi:hypothetical protein